MGKPSFQYDVIENQKWQRCLRIQSGDAQLLVTLDFGPRIISAGLHPQQNLFFTDDADDLTQQGEAYELIGKENFHIFGGHRLWTSPEVFPRTYYPDNSPVEWEETANGVRFVSEAEVRNQVQKSIEIIPDGNHFTIKHSIENVGAWPVEFAAWALSMMAPGGTAIVPQPKKDDALLPNRVLTLWPYTNMGDMRVTWGEKFIIVRQLQMEQAFKIGFSNASGWAAYRLDDTLFVKSFDYDPHQTYPDFNVNFELYTNEKFLELESLSPLKTVQPGEKIELEERWSLYSGVDLQTEDEHQLLAQIQSYIPNKSM